MSDVGAYGLGRKSCDTEPTRFSVDVNRISVDDVRLSFDEPRASWDAYLIARTIPRLTLMFSGIENMILSSFDRTSSIRSGSMKAAGLHGEEAKVAVNSNVFG